jgi:hypothetical protein
VNTGDEAIPVSVRISGIEPLALNARRYGATSVIKTLTAAAFVAATFAAAPAFAAQSENYQAQSYGDPSYYNQNQNDYRENPAFSQGCPRGSIPQSFPGGNGRRCALPNGGYTD